MDWGWLALAFYAGFSLAIVIIGLNRAATTGRDFSKENKMLND
jgi:hypothetical protein